MFHTPKTFFKFGWKQWTTWGGIFAFAWFLYNFHEDIINLIHTVLRNPELSLKIVEALGTGIGGLIGICFNRFKKTNNDDSKLDNK